MIGGCSTLYKPVGNTLNSYSEDVAIGGLPNYALFKILLGYINNPKLAKYLVEGNYEIAGIYPLGAVYVYVNDREINSAAKLAGRR